VGGVIKFPYYSVTKWVYNCNRGTNTKVELLGAWATLFMASHLSINCLQILDDSKVVIDWLSNRGTLKGCAIEGWKDRIKDMVKGFVFIRFDHIPRDFNKDADL